MSSNWELGACQTLKIPIDKDLTLNICQALESVPAHNISNQIILSLDFNFLPLSYFKLGGECTCLMSREDPCPK